MPKNPKLQDADNLRQREADFAVLDDVAEDLKDYTPEELEARISKAVEEVKAEHNAKRAATAPKKIVKRKVDPSEFIVKHSNVKGGRVTRAMAYDDDV